MVLFGLLNIINNCGISANHSCIYFKSYAIMVQCGYKKAYKGIKIFIWIIGMLQLLIYSLLIMTMNL